jgi:hypothetical protein
MTIDSPGCEPRRLFQLDQGINCCGPTHQAQMASSGGPDNMIEKKTSDTRFAK